MFSIDLKKSFINGIYDISIDEYHSSCGISRTSIMEFSKTPFHYYNEYININAKKNNTSNIYNDSIKLGSMFHTYILEPEKFNNIYFISDKKDKRTKEGKEYYSNIVDISKNREIVSKDDFEKIKTMSDVIMANMQIKNLIQGAKYEKSIYWTDKSTGLICKVRPDIWQENFICDIKTSVSADYRSFQKHLYKYGYHIQCAMIHEAFKNVLNIDMRDFLFIVIENQYPYAFAIYKLDESSLEESINIFNNKLLEIKYCLDKNDWPSYKTQIITLPDYAIGE